MSAPSQSPLNNAPQERCPPASYRNGDVQVSSSPSQPGDGAGLETLPPRSHSAAFVPVRNRQSKTSTSAPSRTLRRATYSNATKPTSHIPQDSISSSASKGALMHKRRGSTLKTVMRRIFSRKRSSQLEEAGPLVAEQDGDANDLSYDASQPHPAEPAFLTIAESVRSRSHKTPSLKNNDVSVPDRPVHDTSDGLGELHVSETERGSPLQLEDRRIRRRATLPSLVLSIDEVRELAAALCQQDPRPDSSHSASRERHSVISVLRRTADQSKRRSRSASALRETARDHRMSPIQWRRRSDEIKFWRAGALRANAAPSVSTRPVTRSTVDDVGGKCEGATDTYDHNGRPDYPFNFGTLMGPMYDNSDVSLAQRVTTLEVKLMDLELAIAKLQGHDVSPVQPHRFEAGSRQQGPNPQDVEPTPSPEPGPLTSYLRSTSSATPPLSSPTHEARPSSTVTLRPNTHSSHIFPSQPGPPPVSDFTGISVEQYSALTTLIRREQSARKLLEGQLAQLQRDMDRLRGIDPSSDEDRLLASGSDDRDSFHTDPRQSSGSSASRLEAGSRWKPGRGVDDGHVNVYRSSTEDVYRHTETAQRTQLFGMI